MKTREGDQVDGQLAKIRVELARETERGGNTTHNEGNEVVEVTVGGGGELQGVVADLVEGLVVDAHDLVSVFNQLVKREGGVVGLNNDVTHLRGRNDREGANQTIRELLSQFGKDKGTQTRPSSSSDRVRQLETLQAITSLGLLTNSLQHFFSNLSTLCIMSLSPVVSCSISTSNKVVGVKQLRSLDLVSHTDLHINTDGTRNILSLGSLGEIDL